MKYFVIYDDGIYKETITLQDLLDNYNIFYKLYMNKNFNDEKMHWSEIMILPQYKECYELDTDLDLSQVKEVVEHKFYVDTLALLKVVGKLDELK